MNTKLAANYGTVAGLIAFAYFILLAVARQNPLGNYKLVASVVPIYFLFIGTKKYRDTDLSGAIKYGQAFMFSLTITFFYATIFAALAYIYGKTLDTDLIEIIKSDSMNNIDKAAELLGENSRMVDEAIKQIENMGIGQMAWGEYWNKVIWGFILSLIIAGILKKEKPMFEQNDTTNPTV